MESIQDEVGRTLEVCEGKAGGMAPFLDLPVKDSDLNEKVLALCGASDFGYLWVPKLNRDFRYRGIKRRRRRLCVENEDNLQ
jgi:hypothetical protein